MLLIVKGNYSHENPIKILTSLLESNLCDYSDAYVLVTGNITATPNNAATQVVFKNCAPFEDCRTEINDTFVDYANFRNITMPMYNLIEYSDNYSDTSGSLWDFKRNEIVDNVNMTNDNAPLFEYKASLIGNTGNDGTKNGVKIAVPLKYFSNFWRSLEMPLINCKIELLLKWYERCLLTVANTATFKIIDEKCCAPIVVLSAEDNAKLSKLLGKIFKRPVYWNKYKVIDNKVVEIAAENGEKYIRELLYLSYQGIKRLFVLAYNNTAGNDQVSIDSSKKCLLLRAKIENYNIEIDGKNLYDQPINDSVKQYDEIRKISEEGYDYTTGCLLDFAYIEKNYKLIAVDLNNQKTLDGDSRAIQ